VAKLYAAEFDVIFVEDAREVDFVKTESLRGALHGFVRRSFDFFRRDIYVFTEVFDHVQHDWVPSQDGTLFLREKCDNHCRVKSWPPQDCENVAVS
jgi:hypothetical protein